MALIQLRKPWTRQPQVDAGVYWSHPITNRLVAASIAGGAVNDITVYTSVNGFTPGVSQPGRVANVALSLTQNFVYSGPNAVVNAPFTVVTLAKFETVSAQALFTAYESASRYHELYCSGATGSLVVLSSGSTTSGSASSPTGVVVAGEWAVFGARVDSAGSRSVWKNGAQLATNTTDVGSVAAASNRWGVWNGSTERFNGAFAVRLVWNRALSDAEMAQIGRNPWLVFAPRSILIPVAAAGGAPTITALSARLITTTSAQPRISYS